MAVQDRKSFEVIRAVYFKQYRIVVLNISQSQPIQTFWYLYLERPDREAEYYFPSFQTNVHAYRLVVVHIFPVLNAIWPVHNLASALWRHYKKQTELPGSAKRPAHMKYK